MRLKIVGKNGVHHDSRNGQCDLQQSSANEKARLKYLAQQCFRNTFLEELHAGITPDSKTGDYADVVVRSPYGEIPWPELSRLSDDEMKTLMIDIVNKTYRALTLLFDDRLGNELVQYLARQDPLPRWNEPILS